MRPVGSVDTIRSFEVARAKYLLRQIEEKGGLAGAYPYPVGIWTLGGEIDYIFEALGSAAGHIRSGKLKPIAVTSARRSPSFPDIPTAIEQGLAGFEVTSWYGLWVPRGTPPDVVRRLHGLVNKAFEDPEMRELWFRLGAEQGGIPPEQFAAFVGREVQKWGKVVRDAKVVIE
jgi:tripartite-type tricarboxylate transporter receptor subunit TctC